jgi:hypothetical protein
MLLVTELRIRRPLEDDPDGDMAAALWLLAGARTAARRPDWATALLAEGLDLARRAGIITVGTPRRGLTGDEATSLHREFMALSSPRQLNVLAEQLHDPRPGPTYGGLLGPQVIHRRPLVQALAEASAADFQPSAVETEHADLARLARDRFGRLPTGFQVEVLRRVNGGTPALQVVADAQLAVNRLSRYGIRLGEPPLPDVLAPPPRT